MIRDKRSLLLIGLYTVIAIVAALVIYRAWTVEKFRGQMYTTALNQYVGPAESERVIVEFLDYRCSYCRIIHPVIEEVRARNPDVKIIYRHYPVFGRPSVIEAQVALAAGIQGKFEEAHKALISREEPITDREIESLAFTLGLDVDRFRRDMKGPEIGYMLLETLDAAEVLGIRSTPTFLVGDIVFSMQDGMPTAETFEQLLADAYGDD